MKRLRKRFHKQTIRFYMCGEYGENLGRPHFHACLFGIDFSDRLYFKRTADCTTYTSKTLSDLWPMGHSLIGEVTFESAAYCARYCVAKVTGDNANAWYEATDTETGEIIHRTPEFNHMSLKPGIGGNWLRLYYSDIYPSGECVINGKPFSPPRYYNKKANRLQRFEPYELQRTNFAATHAHDNTDERLRVQEKVAAARLKLSKRYLP